jgi:TRAP-type transport system periplasmic protein
MKSSLLNITVAALALLAATGCAEGGASRAGGATPVVTLRLGVHDAPSAPTALAVQAFVERVRELSGGALRVDPVWAAAGADGPERRGWDQRNARRVMAGELDMGMIPTRAWDTEGVTSLRALSAPFLLTSHALLAKVVADDVTDPLLAGLASAGVTGLALFPEGLRHVFSFGPPVLSPADLTGTTVRTPRSDTGYAVFRAWGATPDDPAGSEFDRVVAEGTVAAADSTFARAGGLPGAGGTVATGNLTPFATVHVLVIQTEVLDDLTDEQSSVLRRAATAARDDVTADLPDEAALAWKFCAAGGEVVIAEPAELAALELAAEPVLRQLEQDPASRAMMMRARMLAAALPPPPAVTPCSAGDTEPPDLLPVAVPADTEGAFPEGVYRMQVSAQSMLDRGASQQDAGNHAGIWTMTFSDGRVVIEDVRARDGQRSTGSGAYCVDAGRLLVALDQSDQCVLPVLFGAGWALDGRELRLVDVTAEDGRPSAFSTALWGGEVWTRVD